MALIRFKDVSLSYNGKLVFEGLSFEVRRGEKVLVLGRSASGKSSLFSLILGFAVPERGEVTFDDLPVNEKTVWEIRRRVSFIDQDVSLGDGKVSQWLRFVSGLRANLPLDFRRERIDLSLGASHHEAFLPYLRDSLQIALRPTLAAMATMGIVALPGMMTGVILGGASPEVAIKYQIMIMIAIVVSTMASVVLTILLTRRICFTRYGTLREEVFAGNSTP